MLLETLLRGLVRASLGPPPAAGGGEVEALDPQLRILLDLQRRSWLPPADQLDLRWWRRCYDHLGLLLDPPAARMHRVEALQIPGPAGAIPARLYVPRAGEPAPLIVFFHGGGFCGGGLGTHDRPCRLLARDAGCLVLAVDYRLAPEHRFPAAVEDCWAAFGWAARRAEALGGDPRRLALCGDSAGGNLSAVVARRARDAGGPPPRLQGLIYPGLDFTCAAPSHRRLGEGYFLTRRMIDGFRARYVPPGHDLRHPEISPLFVRDLGGLPPTLVVTAGFDPLRDEGSDYVRRLREAGVPVAHHHHPTLIHGFLHMTGAVEGARAALEQTARAIGAHLATGVAVS